MVGLLTIKRIILTKQPMKSPKKEPNLTALDETSLGSAHTKAQVNIALIKYWGKRENTPNLPAVGSLSLTLRDWGSETHIYWHPNPEKRPHTLLLNGQETSDLKINKVLNRALEIAAHRGHEWAHPEQVRATVITQNSVPTASGLASSASGMAALGTAIWSSFGWMDEVYQIQRGQRTQRSDELVDLVRIGSGSAIRSLLGGLVRLDRDGQTLTQLCDPTSWSLALVVCVVDPGPKAVSSREGMERTRLTSPLYASWVDSHASDLDEAEEAVHARDLARLGELMEHSTLKMHAVMWGSRPPLRYLKGISLELLDAVSELRSAGVGAWATMDAGPHVKVLCEQNNAQKIRDHLSNIPGVYEVLIRYPGGPVEVKS